jgi:hypothetical protein
MVWARAVSSHSPGSPLLHSRDGLPAASLSPNSQATPPPCEARQPSAPKRRSLDPLPPAWNLANRKALSGGRQGFLACTSLVILKCETAVCSRLRTRPAQTGIFAFNHRTKTPCAGPHHGAWSEVPLTRADRAAFKAGITPSRTGPNFQMENRPAGNGSQVPRLKSGVPAGGFRRESLCIAPFLIRSQGRLQAWASSC